MLIRHLGLVDYQPTWQAMQDWTKQRTPACEDQLWVLQHPPVYTLGLNGKREHILAANNTPIVQCDRGGQVTYHGPGQLVIYPLLDLRRYHLGVRSLVTLLEQSMISTLTRLDIMACAKADAPGVYVDGAKIGSLGLRIYQECSYHGLSLNVAMDLSPFQGINPCGYQGLQMTQIVDHVPHVGFDWVSDVLINEITTRLSHQLRA